MPSIMKETPVLDAAPETIKLPTERATSFDPPAELGRLRDECPVSPLAYPDGHVGWLVTSYSTVRAVLADPRFSARQELHHHPTFDRPFGAERILPAEPGFFIGMDPPDHTRYRKLVAGQFTKRRIEQLSPLIRGIVRERLDELERAGQDADLVADFALPIPTLVICELLGVPYAERGRFQQDTTVFFRLDSKQEDMDAAYANILAYLAELIERKKGDERGDDLLSGLIAGGGLNDKELCSIALLLLVAGHETTANMISLGAFALITHYDQWEALRDDPSLVDNAVEELLRYLPLFRTGGMRTALTDVELGGQLIKEGQCVVFSTTAANRDHERFGEDAETFDIRTPASGHIAFGHGVHQCLGNQLARIEMRMAYTGLAERFPRLRLAIPAQEVPMRSDMAIYGAHRLPVTW